MKTAHIVRATVRERIGDFHAGVVAGRRPRGGVSACSAWTILQPPGSALGLSIARKIVVNHHGSLSFTIAAGRGTSFLLRLPIELPVGSPSLPTDSRLPKQRAASTDQGH